MRKQFEREDIYTYYSNAFHVPSTRKWKLLVIKYENRPQILPLLAPGYTQTCDYLIVMEYFIQFLVERAMSAKERSRAGGIPFICFCVTRPKCSSRACLRSTKDPKDYLRAKWWKNKLLTSRTLISYISWSKVRAIVCNAKKLLCPHWKTCYSFYF